MNHTRQRSIDDMLSMSGNDSPKGDVEPLRLGHATSAHARLKGRQRPPGSSSRRADSTSRPRRTLSEPMLEIGQFSVNGGSGLGLELGARSDSDDEMITLLASQSVEVELQHVSLTLKNDKTKEILHDVSGHM